MNRRRLLGIRSIALVVVVAGCSSGAPAASTQPSSPGAAPTESSGPASVPISSASATAVLPLPTRPGVRLEHARYTSSPPFDIPFTFETPGEGWETLHLLGEFFDVVRFDGASRTDPALRSIAFGHATHVWGRERIEAAGLSAADVAAALGAREDLVAGPPEPFELDGVAGVRVDLRVDAIGTSIFGGPSGNLDMDPRRDARLAIVPVDGQLLMVLVSALPGEVDDAWEQAGPLLESVDL